jgi:hypothetical protein
MIGVAINVLFLAINYSKPPFLDYPDLDIPFAHGRLYYMVWCRLLQINHLNN